VEAVWNLYGPWLKIMLQIGLPLLVLGTPAMFFFERGSTPRWLISKFALWGWVLELLALALYVILRILQDAFTSSNLAVMCGTHDGTWPENPDRVLATKPPLEGRFAYAARTA
jgi:hypothetical protein